MLVPYSWLGLPPCKRDTHAEGDGSGGVQDSSVWQVAQWENSRVSNTSSNHLQDQHGCGARASTLLSGMCALCTMDLRQWVDLSMKCIVHWPEALYPASKMADCCDHAADASQVPAL